MSIAITELISPGERYLWSDRPRQKFGVGWTNILFLTVTGSFFAYSANLFYSRFELIKADPFALDLAFIYALCGISLYMFIGVLILVARDLYRKRQTEYALTNERAIILINGRKPEIHYINLRLIDEALLEKNGDGTQSIRFLSGVNKNDSSADGNALDEACFENLQDASLAFEYIKRATQPSKYH